MEIKDKLAARRKDLGLTLEDVGKMVGVGKSTVRKWETGGIANMKRDKIALLAKALKVSPAYILGLDEKPNNIIPITGMIPIYGAIPAGAPVLAVENITGYIPTMVKNPDEYFYLHVHGTSMINANIPDGALVLVHQQPDAENGQIVACRVNGDEATLKRFKQVGDTVVLMPENPEFQPIVVNCSDFESGYAEVIGVVKQIIVDAK